MRVSILLLVLSFPGFVFGKNYLHQMFTANFGIVNINVTENDSSLVGEDTSSTSTGGTASSSIFSLDLIYEFQNYAHRSFFVRATGPLLSSDNSGLFLGSAGINYFFNSLSSLFTFSDSGTKLTMIPRFKYYLGGAAGLGFLVYSLESAKKSDVFFDLEIHGGLMYTFGKKWGVRVEAGIDRGTGISTSSFGVKFLFGLNMYLDSKNFFN